MGWAQIPERLGSMRGGGVGAPPPGGNGRTMCTGLEGKPWEKAPAAKRSMTALANAVRACRMAPSVRLKFAKTRRIILLTRPREEKNMNSYPRKLLSATLFALAVASTPALSQDTGWYGGIGFGQSDFIDSCERAGVEAATSANRVADSSFLGYEFMFFSSR